MRKVLGCGVDVRSHRHIERENFEHRETQNDDSKGGNEFYPNVREKQK